MEHYTAEVEVARRGDLTHDEIDHIMDALSEYGGTVGSTPRGHLIARVTFPAETITQAVSTAASVVSAALGSTPIRVEAMTETEADAREGESDVPELIGVAAAAGLLDVSPQRVRQMIDEGKLSGYRIGERSFALVKSEVAAKANAA